MKVGKQLVKVVNGLNLKRMNNLQTKYRELGKNFSTFTLYQTDLDDPTESIVRNGEVTYRNRKCHVMYGPMLEGLNGKFVNRATVQLVTNNADDYIEEPFSTSDLHWLEPMGIQIKRPVSLENEREALERKFNWFDHSLDLEGLKELNEWYEEFRYKEEV